MGTTALFTEPVLLAPKRQLPSSVAFVVLFPNVVLKSMTNVHDINNIQMCIIYIDMEQLLSV